jgi:hypothetical protein
VVSVEPGGTVDVVYYESQETSTASNPFCTIRVAMELVGGVPTSLRVKAPDWMVAHLVVHGKPPWRVLAIRAGYVKLGIPGKY